MFSNARTPFFRIFLALVGLACLSSQAYSEVPYTRNSAERDSLRAGVQPPPARGKTTGDTAASTGKKARPTGAESQPVQLPGIEVIGRPEVLERIPGSGEILEKETIENSRIFTTSEVLRKVSGVQTRDEEGFGLRPNIGIRGMNPTRSTKILLLEDGIPLTYAPYGDNATYYHPPIDRFKRIEVLKGSGQIRFGPQTIGGVINYITPAPPARPGGLIRATGGSRGFFNGHVNYGGTWGSTGLILEYTRKQGDGARENVHSDLNDLNFKAVLGLDARQVLILKANYYSEDSNVTYSGLTEAEYQASPRQNAFKNDFMYADRYGASAVHEYAFTNDLSLTTALYGSIFQRHWWRQSSNSDQRPNVDKDGIQGRLRRYHTWGLEPRLRAGYAFSGGRGEAELGVRAHYETQDRRQENGNFPTSRTGALVEDNERKNQAYSAFVQNRFLLKGWTVTPGVRLEHIKYRRANRLANGGAGVSGRTGLTEVVPGIGFTLNPSKTATVFAGVHRGFAPPRTEDIINNNTGGSVDLDPERSWNYELGLRSAPRQGFNLEATVFRMDFQNQVVPASVAGGAGATLTNAGETLHQGVEVTARVSTGAALNAPHDAYLQAVYTNLFTAEFRGARYSSIGGFTTTSVTGNRLPYAPRHLLTATVGYANRAGFDIRLEAVRVSEQFGDDLNTVAPSPNGQRGLIPGYTAWNLAVNQKAGPLTLFLTVKNLFDKTYIVDRTRGILPGSPRLAQGGLQIVF